VISVEDARALIGEHVPALPPVELELSSAFGRVLREPVAADDYYPSADRSMMDGYAIGIDDLSVRFRIVGEITPGMEPRVVVGHGECVRIFTGALVPSGANEVIMQEETERDGEWMNITRRNPRRFIRRRGEEAKPGDVLLHPGMLLGAADLAVLAQVGSICPKVSPLPTITHIATGEELIDPASKPKAGQIRDTNSSLVAALAQQCGTAITAHGRLGDNLEDIVRFASDHPADLLLISGGASVGDHDFGARALRMLDYKIYFERMNLRPGKPLTFASRGRQAAFVIPGNPVSHFVCFHVAIRLALECLQARPPTWSFMNVRLGGNESVGADPRDTFWPAQTTIDEAGECIAHPKRWSSSGDTFSLAGTNALIRVRNVAKAGDVVPALLLGLPG
jgi:molybdopterin molybdotransferase